MAAASVFNVTSGRVVQYSSTRLKRADLVPSSADAEPTGTHASRLVSGCRPMQGAYTWRPSGRGEQQPHRAPVAHTIFFLVGGSGCMAVASKLQGTTIVRRSQDTELHREGWILINPMVTVHRLKKNVHLREKNSLLYLVWTKKRGVVTGNLERIGLPSPVLSIVITTGRRSLHEILSLPSVQQGK